MAYLDSSLVNHASYIQDASYNGCMQPVLTRGLFLFLWLLADIIRHCGEQPPAEAELLLLQLHHGSLPA